MTQERKSKNALLLGLLAYGALATIVALVIGLQFMEAASERDRVATLLAAEQRSKESGEEQYKRAVLEATRKALRFMREHVDPMDTNPDFVFDAAEVPWAALVPLLAYCDNPVEPKLTGSFTSVDGLTTDVSRVQRDAQELRFPGPGRYNLRTNVGSFKVLILDPAATTQSKAAAIGDMIHGNVRLVDTSPDYAAMQPLEHVQRYMRPDKLLGKFFASDQPLEFLCGQISEFYALLLRQEGLQSRSVNILAANGKTGHVLTEARASEGEGWQLLDAYYGLAVFGQDGAALSVAGLRAALNEKQDVRVVALGSGEPVSPEQAQEYLATFAELSSQYWIYEYDDLGQWTKCSKFNSAGEQLN